MMFEEVMKEMEGKKNLEVRCSWNNNESVKQVFHSKDDFTEFCNDSHLTEGKTYNIAPSFVEGYIRVFDNDIGGTSVCIADIFEIVNPVTCDFCRESNDNKVYISSDNGTIICETCVALSMKRVMEIKIDDEATKKKEDVNEVFSDLIKK